jgi:thiosulfate reductase cytochrome b subunit
MKEKIKEKGLNHALLLEHLIPVLLFLFSLAGSAIADKDGIPEDAALCLACHGNKGMFMVFKDNEKMSVTVRYGDLAKSVHKSLKCTDCHQEISMQNHPGKKYDSKMAFVQEVNRACMTCHTTEKLKTMTNHAALVENADVPPCTGCHASHAVKRISALKSSLSGNDYCLFCHRLKISKTFASGEVLSLRVEPANLAASVHNKHTCNDCHSEFSQDSHPKKTYSTGREHSITISGVCRKCHEDKASQVRGSIHYNLSFAWGDTLMQRGNLEAPVCTDCHGFHTVGPKTSYKTFSGIPCRKCHENIFQIYEKSVHGMAKARGEHKAPLCSSCHFAHDVKFTAMTDKMKSICLGCHKDAEALHKKWLPNADLHLNMVACAACHAPASGKGIYLQFVDRNTGTSINEEQILEILGTDSASLSERLNAHGEGIDSEELSYILKQLNKKEAEAKLSYVGRMDVSRYSEAHQLSIKKNAVRECESCHSKDSKFFKSVTLAIVKADGHIVSFSAQPGILGSLRSAGAFSQFYVLGGTRLTFLDWVGVLMVFCGILFPVAHISLRVFTLPLRKRRTVHAEGVRRKIYLHPLPVRIWHWINVFCFLALIFTGIQIRYQEVTSLTKFKTAVSFHNAIGIVLILEFLLWLAYYISTQKIRIYIPPLNPKKFFTGCLIQAKYYGYGLFRGEENPHHGTPEHKFNPLQQVAYFFIMLLLMPLQIITGILLWDVKTFATVIDMLGGLIFVDIVHVVISFAFTAFLFVHIYLTTLGPSVMGHIKAMFTGYEEEE